MKNYMLRYSLEAPWSAVSNRYHTMFSQINKTNVKYPKKWHLNGGGYLIEVVSVPDLTRSCLVVYSFIRQCMLGDNPQCKQQRSRSA